MSQADMDISVTGDVSQGVAGLKTVQRELGATAIAAQKTNSALGAIGDQAKKTGSVFGDFSKIVADRSKGMAGALEEGARASEEVSTGLSDLGELLTGGVLAAGIILATAGFTALGEAVFGVSEYEKSLTASFEAATKEISKAQASVSELTVQVDLAKKGFISKEGVVKQYNDTIGKTAGLVKSVEEVEAALISKGPAYIKLMGLKAIANYAFAKSAELAFQALTLKSGSDAAGLTEKIAKDMEAASKQMNDLGVNATKLAGVVASGGLNFFGDNEEAKTKKAAKTITDVVETLAEKVSVLRDVKEKISAIKSAIVELATTFNLKPDNSIIVALNKDIDNLVAQLPAKKEKIIKDVRSIGDVLKDLADEFTFLEKREVVLNTDEAKARIAALTKTIDELLGKFGLKTDSALILDLKLKLGQIQFDEDVQALKPKFDELVAGITKITSESLMKAQPEVIIKPTIKFVTDDVDADLQKQLSIYQDTLVSAFVSIGEAVGNAVLGQGNFFGNLFGGLLKSLGAGMKQLGQEAIIASTLIVTLRNTIGKVSGIGAGIALVAAGIIVQGIASKIQRASFATGARNFSGGSALVGERGPERVFLPSGSAVQPNNELNAYGGGGGGYIAEVRVQLQELVIGMRKAESSMLRNGSISSYGN